MHTRVTHIALLAFAVFFFSCKNMQSKSHGPIVLGDSSTIVTETDPSRLQDFVADLKPNIPPAARDTVTPDKNTPVKPQDTAKKSAAAIPVQTALSLTGTGLKADFNIVSVLIPNVTAKQSGNPNLEHASGAVYTLVSGKINGNLVKTTANVIKVSQRYQTVILLKNELGVLPLESLGNTTSWEPLKGVNNIYQITGLDEKSLESADANKNAIRNAIAKATRRRHMSRRKMQDWENSVRNVRSVKQKPLYVTLRSVMWKIDGKDADGKVFSKQIRIDIPL